MGASGFAHDYEVVRWVATQLPNLPHIQEHLRQIADGLERGVEDAAASLVTKAAVVAEDHRLAEAVEAEQKAQDQSAALGQASAPSQASE